MNNKVINKQIPLDTIIKTANYIENYKEKYDRKFEIEENKNRNIPFGEKIWEYENGSTKINYTIAFKDGKNITESDYNWFISSLDNPSIIKSIIIDLYISYYTKNNNTNINDIYNKINLSLYYNENNVTIDIDTTNQEKEAHNVYSELINILENNKERYDKTIKYRGIRTQCFTISIGILLSYILFFILKINENNFSPIFKECFNNKYFLILGQWIIAIVLGNLLSAWYISLLYKTLLPERKYVGYDYSSNRGKYSDDLEDYINYSEVHFGKYFDANKRREKIEKIYKITSKILIVQLIISIVLIFVL